MINGETIHRSWLLYSQQSDQIFCFCCKLFGNTASPFCSGMNTWEGISKKLEDHENSTFHKKCFSQWMLLKEGIREQSTIDMQEMQLFLKRFLKFVYICYIAKFKNGQYIVIYFSYNDFYRE